MAQHVQTVMIDDITGKEIPDGEGQTIRFAFQGYEYEIDLDSKGAAKFNTVIQHYIDHGRRIGKSSNVTPLRRSPKNSDLDLSAVRAWAESNGYEISSRGRIKGEIVDAFKAAMA